MKFSSITLLSAATLVVAQGQHAHNHAHNHARRHKRGSPIEAREVVTTTAVGPVVTVYELDGIDVPVAEVEEGLKDGKYVLVTPEEPPTSSSAPAPSSSASPIVAFEKEPSTSSTPPPPPSTKPAAPSPTVAKPAASPATGGNINSPFPDGQIKCSDWNSVQSYGAVPAPWLGLGNWIGIQNTPDFGSLNAASAISLIETAVSGGCSERSFCSYACPPGWQKSQWPSAQGNTGQSIGGLFCNGDGFLELSNKASPHICVQGTGGVTVENKLSNNVCVCRTDYPGTESETVAMNVAAGATEPLTSPDEGTYFQWEGKPTSAQYYLNNQGLQEKDACDWLDSSSNAGNWAPLNLGVGKGLDGNTYVALFPNAPTNPSGILDYDVAIVSGGQTKCSYSKGSYTGLSGNSPSGCTVGLSPGQEAVIVFS